MFVASLIGISLTILLGIAMLGLAMKGFSPAGMPLTSDWRLTGRTGQCVGFIMGLCGVLSIFAGGSILVLRGMQLVIPLRAGMGLRTEVPGQSPPLVSSPEGAPLNQGPASTDLPDEAAATAFVQGLLERLGGRDLENINSDLDFEQILPDGPIPSQVREMMYEDIGKMASQAMQVESLDLTTYRLVRLHRTGNELRALVRVVSGDVLDYVDLVLHRTTKGDIRVGNIYSLKTGRSIREELVAAATLDMPDAQKLSALMKSVQAQEFDAVLTQYAELPQTVQGLRSTQYIRLAAASQVGEDAFVAALEDYRQKFPGDVSADFLRLEQNLADVDPKEAFTCIDRIDEAVSQDVYTNQLRSQVALAGKDFAKAMEYAKKVVDAEPDLVAPYWAVVYAAAQQGDFADAVAWLKKTKNVDPDKEYVGGVELFESPEYAAFIQSQEYLQFLKDKDSPAPENNPQDGS